MDTRTINVLSICSGYGGIELGLHAALGGRTRTVCYVENEIGVASILAARMEDGSLDQAPIWTDLRTFDPEPWRGKVDLVAGGFPCQPHSVAGNKLGEDDPRELSGEVLRIAAGLGYPTLFLENVPGILRFYYDNIRKSLQGMGYSVAEGLFTAAETGAPHKRERLFILAHADSGLGDHAEEEVCPGGEPPEPRGSELAHARGEGLQGPTGHDYHEGQAVCEGVEQDGHRVGSAAGRCCNELAHALYPPGPNDHEGWAYMLNVMPEAQPTFCRVADGATTGVERRLRALGNGVVPAVAAKAYRELTKQLERR